MSVPWSPEVCGLCPQVPRALPSRAAGKSEGLLPEAAEVLCSECTQAQTSQGSEEEVSDVSLRASLWFILGMQLIPLFSPHLQVPIPLLQGNKVLPVNKAGLGGGWAAGVPPGLQYAELADS